MAFCAVFGGGGRVVVGFAARGDSHTGLVRTSNQDSAVVSPSLLLVADGVGGGAAGEVASATTAYAVLDVHAAHAAAADGSRSLEFRATEAVRIAQTLLARSVVDAPERSGMATTLTAMLTDGTTCVLAHVGDSRAYLWRDACLTRLTRDHTWTAAALDRGELTEQEAAEHRWRNVLLRCVDGDPGVTADVAVLDLRPGDRILLASDGLTDLVDDAAIASVLATHEGEATVPALLQAALDRGGRDNITVVFGALVADPMVQRADPVLIGAVADEAQVAIRMDPGTDATLGR